MCCLFPLWFQQLRLLWDPDYMFRVLKKLPKAWRRGGGGCLPNFSQFFMHGMLPLPKPSLRANDMHGAHRQLGETNATGVSRRAAEVKSVTWDLFCNCQSIMETNTSLKVTSVTYIFRYIAYILHGSAPLMSEKTF